MDKYIVIGAGILGSSTAYHLAKSGANVIVIDRQDEGQATDAAAGIICPWISQRRNKAWYSLAKSGAAYYDSLISQLEQDGQKETGYRKVGALAIHTDKQKLEKIMERAIARREDAPEMGDIYSLDAKQTSNLFKPLAQDFSSVWIGGAARVDGRALRNALSHAAQQHGAVFIKGSAEIQKQANVVTGVKVGDVKYEANTVIVTAGAWAGELLREIGVDFQVKGQKAQILHLKLSNEETGNWPVIMPPSDQYVLAFDEGRIVAGATHEDNMEFDQRVTASGMHELLDKALDVAPGLSDAAVSEFRVGYRPYTPGFLPVIGRVPTLEGIVLANGLGASGLTVGPFLGLQLAKLALKQEVDIDLALYDVTQAIL